MEREQRTSSENFFEDMSQAIAEEIIPAESISQPLDATKFEHLKETTEQRAEKLRQARERGTVTQKSLYRGSPVSIDAARASAQSAAEHTNITSAQIETPKPEPVSFMSKAKSFFGKIGGFFKENFGANTQTSREVRIQFPKTLETNETKPTLKTAKEYIEAYFAARRGLQIQFENNSKTPFDKYKNQQIQQLEEKLIQHRAAIESGDTNNQNELDKAINQGIFSQLKGNTLFQKDGSPDLELFTPSKTVRIEAPAEEDESLEEAA